MKLRSATLQAPEVAFAIRGNGPYCHGSIGD